VNVGFEVLTTAVMGYALNTEYPVSNEYAVSFFRDEN
jgi:hypothetical protein